MKTTGALFVSPATAGSAGTNKLLTKKPVDSSLGEKSSSAAQDWTFTSMQTRSAERLSEAEVKALREYQQLFDYAYSDSKHFGMLASERLP